MADSPDFFAVDLREEASISASFSEMAAAGLTFDTVAICSGYTRGHDTIAKLSTESFDDIVSGNLRGPVLAFGELAPLLNNDAAIVIVSTAMGQIGAPGYAGYGAANAGLNSIVRIAAAEFAPTARVNGVAPGAI